MTRPKFRAAKKSVVIDLDGDEDVKQAFLALAYGAQAKVVRPALRMGCRVIREEIRRFVPVKTGALSRAIRVGSRKFRSGRKVGAAVYVDKRKLPDGGMTARATGRGRGWQEDSFEFKWRNVRARDARGRWARSSKKELRLIRRRGENEWFWPMAVEAGYMRGSRKIPAKSYMRAGFDASKERALDAVRKTVADRMGMVWKNPKSVPDEPAEFDE